MNTEPNQAAKVIGYQLTYGFDTPFRVVLGNASGEPILRPGQDASTFEDCASVLVANFKPGYPHPRIAFATVDLDDLADEATAKTHASGRGGWENHYSATEIEKRLRPWK